jgi:hypothetical protein
MGRYDIALKRCPEPLPIKKGSLRKCELWKIRENVVSQGAVCYLKSIDKFENKEKYRTPYSVKLTAQVPRDFHIPLRGPLLLKLDGEEYRLLISEVKQDYARTRSDVKLSGDINFSPNMLSPEERRNLRRQQFDRLSADSKGPI